eukprot:TRINITY_DN10654_c0_g1_i2.p3 TRINITY_DN10654_c0_g1~~TRINITY_DN10654_c0_g1_i2.p3  ORF type:complete len:388 (+),score=40.62 TRINITY_DN10654_c0_g1_i2:95-1165(+)
MAWHKEKGNIITVYLYSYREDIGPPAFGLPIYRLNCHDLRSHNVSICQRYLNSFSRITRAIDLYTRESSNTISLDLSALVTNGMKLWSNMPVVINATCNLKSLSMSPTVLLQSDIQCRCDYLHLRGELSSGDDLTARIVRLGAIIARMHCFDITKSRNLLQQLMSTCILPSVRRTLCPVKMLDLPQEAQNDVSTLRGFRRCFSNAVWLAREGPMAALSNYYSMVVRPLDITDIKWIFEAARLADTQQRMVELLHLVCGLHVTELELPRAVVMHLQLSHDQGTVSRGGTKYLYVRHPRIFPRSQFASNQGQNPQKSRGNCSFSAYKGLNRPKKESKSFCSLRLARNSPTTRTHWVPP